MRGADPARHVPSGVQTRSADPAHRVLQPDPLMHQILPQAPQLTGHAGNRGLGTEMRALAQIRDERLPIDLLEPRLGLTPLEPAAQTIQLLAYTPQALLTQASGFTDPLILVD